MTRMPGAIILLVACYGQAAEEQILTATGAGIADGSRFPSELQAKMLSKRAAMADAQRNLLETINGVQVTAGTTVENMMVTSDKIGTRVKGMIRGAFVVDESISKEGESWITELTMGVCVNAAHEQCREKPTLQQAVAEAIAEAEDVSPFEPSNDAERVQPATGLIVDLSGLDFVPLMDARIRNAAGEELYGPSLVYLETGSDWLTFASSVEEATASASVGDAPLVVQPDEVIDGYKVIVSDGDADRIYQASQGEDNFLRRGGVIFVVRS